MRISIFGVAGDTIRLLVELALQAGHEVVLFTTESNLLNPHQKLVIYSGDLLDKDAVTEAIKGADAVISVIRPDEAHVNGEVPHGVDNIVTAMRNCRVSRIVWSTCTCITDPIDRPTLLHHFLNAIQVIKAQKSYHQAKIGTRIIQRSGLDWVIVRAPILTNSISNGVYRIGYIDKSMHPTCSRENYADFILKQVTSDEWLHTMPVVSDT